MSDQEFDEWENAEDQPKSIGYVDDILVDDGDEQERELDTSNLDDQIWLVKVPNYLADAWDKALEEGKELGTLKHYPGPVIPEGANFACNHILHLPEEFHHIPRDFMLNTAGSKKEKIVIFEGEDNKVGTEIIGTVTEEFTVTAIQTETSHQNLLRGISKAEGENNRQITFDSESVIRPSVNLNAKRPRNTESWGGLGAKQKTSSAPKNSKTKDALRDELFKLFKEYRFWSLKGLRQNTGQSREDLKEVLKDITVHHRKGKYHTLYQLKAEYGKNIIPKFEIAVDDGESDKEDENDLEIDGAEDSYAVDEADKDNEDDDFEEIDA